MKNYKEQMKDPRWQKKRLEVFDHDKWSCQGCGDTTTTLAVHHIQYFKGRQPWEYNTDELITLCERCHSATHNGTLAPNREIVVYFAGKIYQDDDWRNELFKGESIPTLDGPLEISHVPKVGKHGIVYGGPYFYNNCGHGYYSNYGQKHAAESPQDRHTIFRNSATCIDNSNMVAVYADSEFGTAHGTMVEIGYAFALGKPIVLFFQKKECEFLTALNENESNLPPDTPWFPATCCDAWVCVEGTDDIIPHLVRNKARYKAKVRRKL